MTADNNSFTSSGLLSSAGVALTPQQTAVFGIIANNETSSLYDNAFQLIPAGKASPSSGYSIGPVQLDLHSNPDLARQAIDSLLAATAASAQDIQTVDAALRAYQTSGSSPLTPLPSDVQSIINEAAATGPGQISLTQSSASFFLNNVLPPVTTALQQIDAANLAAGIATNYAGNPVVLSLFVDTKNQYVTEVNTELSQFLSGTTFTADSTLKLNLSQAITIDPENPIPSLAQFLLSTDAATATTDQNYSQLNRVANTISRAISLDPSYAIPGNYYFSTDHSASDHNDGFACEARTARPSSTSFVRNPTRSHGRRLGRVEWRNRLSGANDPRGNRRKACPDVKRAARVSAKRRADRETAPASRCHQSQQERPR